MIEGVKVPCGGAWSAILRPPIMGEWGSFIHSFISSGRVSSNRIPTTANISDVCKSIMSWQHGSTRALYCRLTWVTMREREGLLETG